MMLDLNHRVKEKDKRSTLPKRWLVAGTLFLFFTGFCFSGCKKVLDIHSSHAVNEKNFWNSHNDTRAALIGVYGLMRAALANDNGHWMYGELRHGDFISLKRQDLKAIISGDLTAQYPMLNELSNWRRFYAVINAANMFLEHVDEVKKRDPKYSDQNMRVDIAQIRVLRAFAYFYMVRIWGDVPLITTSHDGEFKDKGRTDQKQVLAFVEYELKAAAKDLPYRFSAGDEQQQGDYYNEDQARWMGVPARKLTAYTLLAHVAAWQGRYSDVATYTKFIMDNYPKGGHSFVSTESLTDPNGFFYDKKDNFFWAFNFVWGHADASFSGHIEQLTLAEPITDKSLPDIYVPKDSILSIFDMPKDERFSLDTLTGEPTSERYFASFNTTVPIFDKIKVLQGGGTDPDFRIYSSAIVFTRLEEIALLRAEALTVLGDVGGAVTLLNQVRDLREVDHYNAVTEGDDILYLIFRERRKELMGEAWRWYDLIRYNKIKQNNPDFMQLINSGGIYWPVSENILQQNDLIKQNPYWK